MTEHVLAAVDGSHYSEAVCDYAAWASLVLDAPLKIIHVVDNHSEVPEEQIYQVTCVSGHESA